MHLYVHFEKFKFSGYTGEWEKLNKKKQLENRIFRISLDLFCIEWRTALPHLNKNMQ